MENTWKQLAALFADHPIATSVLFLIALVFAGPCLLLFIAPVVWWFDDRRHKDQFADAIECM